MPRYLHIPHTPDTARTLTLSGRNCLAVSGMKKNHAYGNSRNISAEHRRTGMAQRNLRGQGVPAHPNRQSINIIF